MTKIFCRPFQGCTYFVDHLCYLCLVFVMLSRLFLAALWSPVGKELTSWLLIGMFNCVFVTFPCGILGQVWYLIVLIPDLFRLPCFNQTYFTASSMLRISSSLSLWLPEVNSPTILSSWNKGKVMCLGIIICPNTIIIFLSNWVCYSLLFHSFGYFKF